MISFRYQDKGTIIHRLNPFCKLAWLGSVLVLALLFDNPLYLLLLLLSTLLVIRSAGIWREWASLMKFIFYLCLLVIVINALVNYQGSHILVQASFRLPVMGIPTLTLEAMIFGVAMSIRLLAIISVFVILTLTIHPDDLMLAMIKLKLPYKSVLVTSLSTRFVPTLIDDVERITDVQRCRGLELDKGNLLQRVKNHMPIVIPLLSNSLDRTVQVAEAMESRAFGVGGERTFYREIMMSKIDISMLILGVAPCVLGIFMRSWEWGVYQYYPTLGEASLDSLECLMLVFLVFLLCLMPSLAFLKKRIDLD